MGKKVVFTISKSGNMGKSFIAGLILEHLRYKLGLTVSAYLCDISPKHDSLRKKYATKDEDGNIEIHQDPLNGVYSLDLDKQKLKNEEILDESEKLKYDEKIRTEFQEALIKDYDDISLFDCHATHLNAIITTAFKNTDEFMSVMQSYERTVYLVMPLGNAKSLEFIKEVFIETNQYSNIHYVVVLNKGCLTPDVSIDDYYTSDIYKHLKSKTYSEFTLPTFKQDFFDATENDLFSHFMKSSTVVDRTKLVGLKNGLDISIGLTNMYSGFKTKTAEGKVENHFIFEKIEQIFR